MGGGGRMLLIYTVSAYLKKTEVCRVMATVTGILMYPINFGLKVWSAQLCMEHKAQAAQQN